MKKLFFTIIFSAIIVASVAAQTEAGLRLPEEVKPFVEAGARAIVLKKADLNGDRTLDYIVVLDKANGDEDIEYAEYDTSYKPTLIIVRDRAGKLSLAARNDWVVVCRRCGAPDNEPFEGIVVEKNGFTIKITTGTKAHITHKSTFSYSRSDKTWLLRRVSETDYDIYTDRSTTHVFYAPRDFGAITFADFSLSNYLGKGSRQNPTSGKTRDVTIYASKTVELEDGTLAERLVPVPRKIVDDRPLGATLRLLLEGTTEDESTRGLAPVATDLVFYSARVRNRTAQINLKFENEELVNESWEGSGFDNEQFVKAVELTARQFAGVERVSICVNGKKNYADFGSKPVKCSFGMFPPQY